MHAGVRYIGVSVNVDVSAIPISAISDTMLPGICETWDDPG